MGSNHNTGSIFRLRLVALLVKIVTTVHVVAGTELKMSFVVVLAMAWSDARGPAHWMCRVRITNGLHSRRNTYSHCIKRCIPLWGCLTMSLPPMVCRHVTWQGFS